MPLPDIAEAIFEAYRARDYSYMRINVSSRTPRSRSEKGGSMAPTARVTFCRLRLRR